MSAYAIANYTIHDESRYYEYVKAVRATILACGGHTLVADHAPRVIEGEARQVVVVVQFQTLEAAQAWYRSPAYQEVIGLRIESTAGWVALCQGFTLPQEISA